MVALQGCGSDSPAPAPAPPAIDCTDAYRQKCFNVAPFNTCCFNCGGGSGSQTCDVTKTHSLHGTPLTLRVTYDFDLGDADCKPACDTLNSASWTDFCDNTITSDPHVQACTDALNQVTAAIPTFCSNSSLAAVASDPDPDFCRRAYNAGCWAQTPFNDGCCASTCDASAGEEKCTYLPTKTQQSGDPLKLNVTFSYDPDDDNCKDTCTELQSTIWTDFCDGGALSQNDKVKNCDAAMQSIHHQVHDVVPQWCGSSLKQEIV